MKFPNPIPRSKIHTVSKFPVTAIPNRSPGNIPTGYLMLGDSQSLAPTPSNLALIKRTKTYGKDLAKALKPEIDSAREFLLKELFPPMLALHNGMQDGFDVMRLMIDETPAVAEVLGPMEQMLTLALRIKMATFISKHASLSAQELSTFMHIALDNLRAVKENNSQYKAIGELIQSLANSGDSNPAVGSQRSPRRVLRELNRQKHLREESKPEKK